MAKSKITYGMVGGGQGAFIGDVHRKAIALDGKASLAAGSFSSDRENTMATGAGLGLDPDRVYGSYQDMARAEGRREDGIDFVSIVTPNHLHHPVARAFLENGIHVVCDKPLALETAQALELESLAAEKDLLFCVTYTYTGYLMVKHVRGFIASGGIGRIRFVNAEYPQQWLSTRLEDTDHKQAGWRMDPARTGPANSVGDIGTHIENMVSYMTGLKIRRLLARLDTLMDGRPMDDNASMLVDYDSGARGLYWCSQVAVGHDNGLKVRIFGETGSVEWCQEDPEHAIISDLDGTRRIISRGREDLSPGALAFSRVPPGHPEGYFVAFANVYRAFVEALSAKLAGTPMKDPDYPDVRAGVSGVKFIAKCVESSRAGGVWVDF